MLPASILTFEHRSWFLSSNLFCLAIFSLVWTGLPLPLALTVTVIHYIYFNQPALYRTLALPSASD